MIHPGSCTVAPGGNWSAADRRGRAGRRASDDVYAEPGPDCWPSLPQIKRPLGTTHRGLTLRRNTAGAL